MKALTKAERRQLRSQIACSLCNLHAFRLFWLPVHRRIMARSISCTRQFRVPPGAELVGVYAHGVDSAGILDDLAEVIRRTPEPVPAPMDPEPEPEVAPPAGVAGAGKANEGGPKPTPAPHPWRAPAGS